MAEILPDYRGGSIVNLMASIADALGAAPPAGYPPLRDLDTRAWGGSRNLVLLVIDGLGYWHLERTRLAVLSRHLKARLTSVFPSTTATAVPTFLTGLAPQQHGLTGWHMYFRELGSVLAVLPFHVRCGGEPLGKAGIDAAALLASRPLSARLPVRAHVVSPRRIIHSDFNLAHTAGAQRHGFDTLKEMFQALAQIVRGGRGERRYVHAYWPELDRLAHEHGIASPEAAAHLAGLDETLGHLLHRIEGSDTTVVITADHGFVDSGPERLIGLDTHPGLADTLVLPLCGERRVAYCYVHPDRRLEFEARVADELGERAVCHRSEALIAAGYFGLGTPHARLGERVGHYTLIMKDSWALKDWVPGERRHVHIGVHGGVTEEEMYVPLCVATV